MASNEEKPAGDGHGAATLAEGGAHGEPSGVFPPFDSSTYPSQLLWLVITFVTLYYLIAKVAVPRISGILENRRDRIASDLDTAERLKGESDEAIAGYEQALAQARDKAYGIAETARQEARDAAEAKRTEIEADLEQKLAAAETRIGEIKAQALNEVGAIASETAAEVVDALIGAKVDAKEANAAVSSVMKEEQGGAV